MTGNMVSAVVAQKWANLLAACCPEVTRTQWHVAPDEIAITAWFRASKENLKEGREVVELVASGTTIDEYARASDVAQFRADTRLIEFVKKQHQRTTGEQWVADPESQEAAYLSITSTRLGLYSHRA